MALVDCQILLTRLITMPLRMGMARNGLPTTCT